MAGAIYSYSWSTSTVLPPPNKRAQPSDADVTLATRLYLDNTTSDNTDIHDVLLTLPVGAAIAFQSAGNGANAVEWTVTAAPTDGASYVDVPVAFVSQRGIAFTNGQAVDGLFFVVAPSPNPSPNPATLLTLQQAKDHLEQVWAAGDPREVELQAKIDAAEAIILDYLKATDATALVGDAVVIAAVKLELGELWRFRGDDVETKLQQRQADGYLSAGITALLNRKRPLTVA